MKRFNWLTAPRYDLSSFRFFGVNISDMACTFELIGFIMVQSGFAGVTNNSDWATSFKMSYFGNLFYFFVNLLDCFIVFSFPIPRLVLF